MVGKTAEVGECDCDYDYRYGTVLYLLTQFLLPFLLITILNAKMVNTIVTARKQRALLTMSEKSEHRTALMMVMVVIIFVCCYTLSVRYHSMFYRPVSFKI